MPLIIKPNSRPQEEFFAATEKEVLYGGAAGAGKTFALIVDPMRYIHLSRFTGTIFRRTYQQLEKSVIPLAKQIYLAAGATYNEQKKIFYFPSGAEIRLGYLASLADVENYQGGENSYYGFDELTHYDEAQYTGLMPWNRSPQEGVRAYIRCTSNPGGRGHLWVKRRFVDVCKPEPYGEPIVDPTTGFTWQPMQGGKPYFDPVTQSYRRFIPSRVFDNIDNMRRNPDYARNLMALPPRKMRAMLEGDWNAFEGSFFDVNLETQIIKPFQIDQSWQVVASVDPGFSSPCAVNFLAQDQEGNIYVLYTYYEEGRKPSDHAEAIRELISPQGMVGKLLNGDGLKRISLWPSGLDAFARKDRYSILASEKTFADIFLEQGIALNRAVTDRVPGWWAVKELIPNRLFFFDQFTNPLIEEMTAAVADENNPEDIEGKGNAPGIADHAMDSLRYGVMSLYRPERVKVDNRPEWLKKLEKRRRSKSGNSYMSV